MCPFFGLPYWASSLNLGRTRAPLFLFSIRVSVNAFYVWLCVGRMVYQPFVNAALELLNDIVGHMRCPRTQPMEFFGRYFVGRPSVFTGITNASPTNNSVSRVGLHRSTVYDIDFKQPAFWTRLFIRDRGVQIFLRRNFGGGSCSGSGSGS